ncbi:MAG: hypothetical protein DRP94_02090 [Candidatus Latescibacterota bacterium]|nr:MAG: hypothetical protein DRP94_02090 [Candidatus Latescibacterota bacterium]
MRCRKVGSHEAGFFLFPVPVAYKVDRTEKVKVSKINSLKEPHLTRLSRKVPKLTSSSFGKNDICIFSLTKTKVPAEALEISHKLYASEFSISQKPDFKGFFVKLCGTK